MSPFCSFIITKNKYVNPISKLDFVMPGLIGVQWSFVPTSETITITREITTLKTAKILSWFCADICTFTSKYFTFHSLKIF